MAWPSRMSWDVNPHNPHNHFCLDPSSSKAVQFLRERTVTLMKKYQPALLKFDFGYGLPNPNVGGPRDPSLRGERYCLTLLKIVADAARSVSRDVSIEYYSIHPLVRSIANVVSMDDLGDAGLQEAAGHRQWSVWSALAGHGTGIMASSGYLSGERCRSRSRHRSSWGSGSRSFENNGRRIACASVFSEPPSGDQPVAPKDHRLETFVAQFGTRSRS